MTSDGDRRSQMIEMLLSEQSVMSDFHYRDGRLHAEGVAIEAIAEAVGTPFYCYSGHALETAYRSYADAFHGLGARIHYAVKANSNQSVLTLLAGLGSGADVVSGGELKRALAAGIAPDHIVFSGVGKTDQEISDALETGIYQLNAESIPEIERIAAVASGKGMEAPVAVRVNPDIDAGTHAKITTGKSENKFGIAIEETPDVYARMASLGGIRPVGLAMHLGSQLTDLAPYRSGFERLAVLVRTLRDRGLDVPRLDLGGGLGITYHDERPPQPADLAALVEDNLGPLGCSLSLEPGRAIAGNAGLLVSRVIFDKQGPARRFLIVDAAMNDLLRPSLYDAWHTILPVAEPDAATDAMVEYDVVGPVCESGDTFARGRLLPELTAGKLIAFASAGAYSAVMASTYNARPLVPEVLVQQEAFAVVRKRQDVDDLIRQEPLAPWLTGG